MSEHSRTRSCAALVLAFLAIAIVPGIANGARASLARDATAQATGGALLGPGMTQGSHQAFRWIKRPDGRWVWAIPLNLVASARIGVRAHQAGALFGFSWFVQNYNNGLCMSSYPDVSGSVIDQYTCNQSNNQLWLYGAGPDGTYRMMSDGATGLCMDNYQWTFRDDNPQILYPCGEGAVQAEAYDVVGPELGGYSFIETEPTSHGYCLSTLGLSGAIDEWTCIADDGNQAFN